MEGFAERYDEQLEEFVEQAAEAELLALPLAACLSFLKAGDVPARFLDSISQVTADENGNAQEPDHAKFNGRPGVDIQPTALALQSQP
ncbi:hypothetical protein [Ruegeria sp. HKCCA5463]|uniref:hypothetical protein n=1 Tax=Ruegeria sp. HKCCA5463 TaxID=2682994 RepID=UPI001487D9CE|nr:hypothetical protein [Ruegeria sp. HKCCA5463]